MKKRHIYIVLIALGIGVSAHAQLDPYKYIIVPKKFDAFKSENQYQTSTLVKHYLTEYGLTAVYDDALPLDLAENRCLGLIANILDDSSMFTTKLKVSLKNCQNQEVFTTREGRSKAKEFDVAYREALEKAFGSLAGLNYVYNPPRTVAVAERPNTVEPRKLPAQASEKAVEQKATQKEQLYKSVEPRPSNINRPSPTAQAPNLGGLLYAQPVDGGYQLVNSVPEIVLKLEETSMENIFLTQYSGNNAMVFKKDDKWFLEYVDQGEKKNKELQIKF